MSFWLLLHIHSINFLYAVAGLLLLALTIFLAYDYFYRGQKFFLSHLVPYVWGTIIVTSFGAVATTLLYSEVFGFIPCSLCWLQRVALYPQILLSLIAWRIRDARYFPVYGMAMSAFGFLIAVYQYIYQMIPTEILKSGLMPCLADGSADCAKKVMEVFGFVTFPFLSAVLFAFLIALYMHLRRAGLPR